MERQEGAGQATDSIAALVDQRVSETEARLRARMTEQDLVVAELERRVKALEEALRLLSSTVQIR